ncbi:hypothetical protein F5B20DRAFT_591037 [Whalleya microplaca]|nr:hypothetical protein F5B20DRAFT_591037 [Whalleya microplaca]
MSSNISALALLGGFRLWDACERQIAKNNARRYKEYGRVWDESACKFNPSDVSIVVPTVDWDSGFENRICLWLANDPKEIIIVTTTCAAAKARAVVESDLVQAKLTSGTSHPTIQVITVQRANKREQLCHGINRSTGKIVALVDDDAIWRDFGVTHDKPHRSNTLLYLLAPFNNKSGHDIGLVGGPIVSYVPEERRDGKVITAWEVAALRSRQRRGAASAAAFMADGGINFTMSGLTMLLRAEILKDPFFQYGFMEETFHGQRLNSGDDAFITRWVLFAQHRAYPSGTNRPELLPQYQIGLQLAEGATVETTIKADNNYVSQVKRWTRTGLQNRLTCLFYEPGFWRMYRSRPYMARKMVESILNPLLTIIRWIVLWKTFIAYPILTCLLIAYDLCGWYLSLHDFVAKYPYTRRKIWAAMIGDHLSLVTDLYSWLTLGTEDWSTRASTNNQPSVLKTEKSQ